MNPNEHKIKRALISVSDKKGILEFANKLNDLDIELISTGGTHRLLTENGLSVKQVNEITEFPEIMNGRVKTLHPKIHGGLLADIANTEHQKAMEDHKIESIDLLVVNLYPFENVLKKENATHGELIENIDIGGPAMLRAAAKNYRWTAVLTDPSDYQNVLEQINNSGTISLDMRTKLASKVFSLTSFYDSLIANYLKSMESDTDFLNIGMRNKTPLRYGENPAQKANLYGEFSNIFQKLHGKDLSYNNIMDIDAAAKLILEFTEETACGIIKHTNPCGVGVGDDLIEAYEKAFATDTVSPFGGIMIFNKTIDIDLAEKIHKIFTEVVIAPEFSDEALNLLTKKKDRRLIKLDFAKLESSLDTDYRSVAGGILEQDYDKELIDKKNIRTVSEREPSDDEYQAMMFAWKVAKHVKSNAIVYALKDRTLGIGAGQMSRVDSARIARQKSATMGLDLKACVLASDAFFPFADGLEMAAEAGATAVIQPGGSIRDEEVINAANEHNISMVFTGMRHFRH